MTDSFFHIDPADNLALTDIVCFFIQLLIACLRRIALQIILPKNSGAFDSSQMSPSTITYDLNVASMAENRVKCSRGDMSHVYIYIHDIICTYTYKSKSTFTYKYMYIYIYTYIASPMGNSWGIHPDKVAREYPTGETLCFLFGRSQSACPKNYHVRFSI